MKRWLEVINFLWSLSRGGKKRFGTPATYILDLVTGLRVSFFRGRRFFFRLFSNSSISWVLSFCSSLLMHNGAPSQLGLSPIWIKNSCTVNSEKFTERCSSVDADLLGFFRKQLFMWIRKIRDGVMWYGTILYRKYGILWEEYLP